MTISVPRFHQKREPFLFEEYFEMGKEERLSPFLTQRSRQLSANLTLKGAVFAAVLLLFSFALSWSPTWMPVSSFLLIGVYVFAGIPALIESVEDLGAFIINIDVLMTLAAFASVFIGSGMEGGLLLVLFALSGAIEDAVTAKAKSSLHELHQLAPTKAVVLRSDGTTVEVSLRDVSVGTRVLVKAGEVVPLDGKVLQGASSVNMSHLTGESIPVPKKEGDSVVAGARNLDGVLEVDVACTSADSTLARMIRLVTQAQEARPKWQQWFDRWSQTYAMSIIGAAVVFAVSFPWLFSIPFLGPEGALYRALAFLIAASPCALIIAIPIAYLSAVSVCAREGILMKGGIVLDALAHCSVIAFDKTGTLTTGTLTCLGFEPIGRSNLSEEDILAIAAGLERNAVHPMAEAVLLYAEEKGVRPAKIDSFQAIPGTGVRGDYQGVPVMMGHWEGVAPTLSKDVVVRFQNQGEGVAALSVGEDVFLFRFLDALRPEVPDVLEKLHRHHGLTLAMLTGDHKANADRIAKDLPLDEVLSDLHPEDKLHWIDSRAEKEPLAMVGDGMNDAPALARATVGIAMGKGSSMTAVEAADIVLLHNHIGKLDWLWRKGKKTERIVRQNLWIATSAIIIAAFPALGGLVPLWLAVIMHEGGTLLVGLNALRLLRRNG